VVIAAGRRKTPESDTALAALCEIYWYPLYVYVRRQGHQPADAQDLTQEFFARLLEKHYLRAAHRERGRFRTFLLTALKRFLQNERKRAAAQKRGGGRPTLSIDFESGEERFQRELSDDWTPERVYERRWALTLLNHVLDRLEGDYTEKRKGPLFQRLRVFITATTTVPSYAEVAAELGMTKGSVKVAVHRLRQRYRDLLRAEIANTVSSEDDVDEELDHLLAAIIDG
jgi:RNA polymerase sigma-70 factor (ECF subfamily)